MVALLKLLIFGLIFLTAIYFALSWSLRKEHRRKLEREWEDTGKPGNLEAYRKAGMEQYERSLKRRLLWLVYILPVTSVVAIIYISNYM